MQLRFHDCIFCPGGPESTPFCDSGTISLVVTADLYSVVLGRWLPDRKGIYNSQRSSASLACVLEPLPSYRSFHSIVRQQICAKWLAYIWLTGQGCCHLRVHVQQKPCLTNKMRQVLVVRPLSNADFKMVLGESKPLSREVSSGLRKI